MCKQELMLFETAVKPDNDLEQAETCRLHNPSQCNVVATLCLSEFLYR